jgi:hypothetical protein
VKFGLHGDVAQGRGKIGLNPCSTADLASHDHYRTPRQSYTLHSQLFGAWNDCRRGPLGFNSPRQESHPHAARIYTGILTNCNENIFNHKSAIAMSQSQQRLAQISSQLSPSQSGKSGILKKNPDDIVRDVSVVRDRR